MSGVCPEFIARLQVPEHFPVSLRTVDTWISLQSIPVVRFGRKVVFRSADIRQLFNSHLTVPAAPPAKVGRPTKASAVARRAGGNHGL